jgi:hypothetical protein
MKAFLFDELPEQSNPRPSMNCGLCKHIERWLIYGYTAFYCAITKSNRTANDLLKVKCKTPACALFEPGER